MDYAEFPELIELIGLLESSHEDASIRECLRKMVVLKPLKDKTREDWVKYIQSREKEVYLLILQSECDSLGAFCELETLEDRLKQVPDAYQDTYTFGYFRGIADYRQATEWLGEKM